MIPEDNPISDSVVKSLSLSIPKFSSSPNGKINQFPGAVNRTLSYGMKYTICIPIPCTNQLYPSFGTHPGSLSLVDPLLSSQKSIPRATFRGENGSRKMLEEALIAIPSRTLCGSSFEWFDSQGHDDRISPKPRPFSTQKVERAMSF
jgi:hypothetical protein